jgi:hypothetical protein
MEAYTKKYTFVRRMSTKKYEQKLDEKFRQIVIAFEKVAEEDEPAEKE